MNQEADWFIWFSNILLCIPSVKYVKYVSFSFFVVVPVFLLTTNVTKITVSNTEMEYKVT